MPWNALNLSQDSKDKLNKLRSRKQDETRHARLLSIYWAVLIGVGILFFMAFNKTILVPAGGDAMALLELFLGSKSVSLLFFVAIGLIMLIVDQAKRLKKAKDKVKALRIEIVDKLRTSWVKTNNSDLRDTITRMVKEETDVDIYYSS
ncbi:DUF2663 family protein [Paenibacillus sp. R14(2021)]|uniref:DUF2663 family protein n=1 Tax=Paenibacillus sp. R14(2021) TaxID=2859228 RepID=UPI001C6169C4|nr:DUF2663 family protein [Paenibacillus sp. R14(2021)]